MNFIETEQTMREQAARTVEQPSLDFTTPPAHRRAGHQTSVEGAVAVRVRAGSQRFRLLEQYANGVWLTDEEAAEHAALERACYWKRCGELRAGGFIAVVTWEGGGEMTREGSAGVKRIVCALTPQGQRVLDEMRNG